MPATASRQVLYNLNSLLQYDFSDRDKRAYVMGIWSSQTNTDVNWRPITAIADKTA
ncbi:MAG: hypothetical protein ACRCVV_21895 [Shewanella sp.]